MDGDRPRQGNARLGLVRELDDPAPLAIRRMPGPVCHLNNLTCQRMTRMDHTNMSHTLCLIRGILLYTPPIAM